MIMHGATCLSDSLCTSIFVFVKNIYTECVCGCLYVCVSAAVVSECCCWGLLHHCPHTVAAVRERHFPQSHFSRMWAKKRISSSSHTDVFEFIDSF